MMDADRAGRAAAKLPSLKRPGRRLHADDGRHGALRHHGMAMRAKNEPEDEVAPPSGCCVTEDRILRGNATFPVASSTCRALSRADPLWQGASFQTTCPRRLCRKLGPEPLDYSCSGVSFQDLSYSTTRARAGGGAEPLRNAETPEESAAALRPRRTAESLHGNLKTVVNWHWKGNKLHTPSGAYHPWANVTTAGKAEGAVVRWDDGEAVLLGGPAGGGPRRNRTGKGASKK